MAKWEYRKMKIKSVAEFIGNSYLSEGGTDLNKIAIDEKIPVLYDNYEDAFDGILVYENKRFYIHLNQDKGNLPETNRSRFSLAHEFGHYFLDEHRIGLMNRIIKSHPSSFHLNSNILIEKEADYFAACLLMPSERFKKMCGTEKMSLSLIEKLSKYFKTSRLSTLLRFAEKDAGTYPIMISFFKKGLLEWFKQSDDFPFRNVPFKSKKGHPPPPLSVIGEYYRLLDAKYTDVQEIASDDWFCVNSSKKMQEQCFYSDYGFDISIVWPL
jgi:Zn-dependent peptidase ImmA (M78 family)